MLHVENSQAATGIAGHTTGEPAVVDVQLASGGKLEVSENAVVTVFEP